VFPWLWQPYEQRPSGRPSPDPPPSDAASPPDAAGETPERVLYDAAARFIDLQVSTNDVLDNKAANIFSVGSTVLPVTFGLLSLAPNSVPALAVIALGASLVAYVALLACTWRASAIRALEYRPDIPTLERHSHAYEGSILLRWVASEYMRSTEVNRTNLEHKARWTGAANTALYAEGLLLSLAAILTLL
jgi:hypothetical protein